MNVDRFIEALESLCDAPRFVRGSIDEMGGMMYVYIFCNFDGFPAIQLVEEEPPIPMKTCVNLLRELVIWRNESAHYTKHGDVYLFSKFDYPDESYDFRHFKLENILLREGEIVLISDGNESLQLRRHFDAFDEGMLANDDDDG